MYGLGSGRLKFPHCAPCINKEEVKHSSDHFRPQNYISYVVSLTLQPLHPLGMGNLYPLSSKLGRSYSRSGPSGEENYLLPV